MYLSAISGTFEKQNGPRGSFSGFGAVKMPSWALLRIRGANLVWVGVSVCVSGAVCVCGEYRGVSGACLDVFRVVSLSGTVRPPMFVPLEKPAFGCNASLQSADPNIVHFLEHLMAACPRPVHTTAAALDVRRLLTFGAMLPSERSLRSHDSGTPSAGAIFLAPKPRVAMRSMAKRSSVDNTML